MINSIKDFLKNKGWEYEEYETPKSELEITSILARYAFLDDKYITFLQNVKSFSNKTVWFNTYERIVGNIPKGAFRWNEFEQSMLEFEFSTEEEKTNDAHFWDNHIPIMLDCYSDHTFYALRNDGKIVYQMVIYINNEEPKVVANSFEEFLGKIIDGNMNHIHLW